MLQYHLGDYLHSVGRLTLNLTTGQLTKPVTLQVVDNKDTPDNTFAILVGIPDAANF